MLHKPASLLTVLLALSANTLSQVPPSAPSDDQIRRQTRKQALGTSFLQQLGLSEVPPKSNITVVPSPAEKAEFNLITQIVNITTKERRRGSCQSTEYFQQHVSTFVGITNKYLGKFTHRSVKSVEEGIRSAHYPSNRLYQVPILFNFNLDPEFSVITEASLILDQIAASQNDYVRDEEQYVEVESIVPIHSRYLATTVVAGRFVNISDYGPLLFDITTAVEQWIAMEIQGKIDLVISTYCFSSPLCAQRDDYGKPKSFMFVEAPPIGQNAPRIVVQSSTNPLERRTKRQAIEGGASFCIEGNDAQCCLVPFVLHFVEDLGDSFSFIIEPPAYQSNYCDGICPTSPGGQLMVPVVFSFISQLKNNPASSLTPCCGGHTHDSLPVLLNFGGLLETRVIENVVVSSCTCT